ncbi:MAG: hypothetical protein L3J37_07800 [Rhodobacteraceae bacterium]|nr:hypothetical protein [Paracoccaceae bacterium]
MRSIVRNKFAALILAGFTLSACTTIGETAGMGAVLGAGIAGVTGGNMVTGAAIGGAAGAACYQTNTC